ncbi:hypothetical protein FHR92_000386 [Fontibacillus solani]|uniref:Uncharacterized protein n=1 Tax=Fontibacillus solani TaxID=1572857 RepID=A0A7W3SPX8_9BACL|nr:hypothetical protein [Fontibacillus solani]
MLELMNRVVLEKSVSCTAIDFEECTFCDGEKNDNDLCNVCDGQWYDLVD